MALGSLLFASIVITTALANDCLFDDASGGTSKKLDLSSLQGINITYGPQELDPHVYAYSPCSNNFRCDYGNNDVLVIIGAL